VGAPKEKEAEIPDGDALTVLAVVLKDRGEAGWDLDTRCRFLSGGKFTRGEAGFVVEAFNVYTKDLEGIEEQRQSILKDAGLGQNAAVAASLKDLDEKQGKVLEAIRKDLGQIRGGALKPKLDALLFLMKRGILTTPSKCQERIARLLTYTAMSETADGKVTAMALTISTAWSEHRVRAKTILKGPGAGSATKLGEWGHESAAAVWLGGAGAGLFVGDSEHYESCAGSNLTKMAGSTRGTKFSEPAARAALN
jgi:hypothetical protein